MPIQFTCPHCGKATNVADQYAGQTGPCANCGQPVVVPQTGGTPFTGPGVREKSGIGAGMIILIGAVVMIPVILGVIGILIALLLPAVQAAREAARRAQCTNNLKQIGLAMHNYQQVYGVFPPAFVPDKNGKPMHSWRVLILPYMEQQALYSLYRFDEPWDGPHNSALAQQMPAVYRCASESGPRGTETSYAMLVGPHCISDGPNAHRSQDITSGPSNTMMVAECSGAGINWMDPRDIDAQTMVNFSASGGAAAGSPPVVGINSCHPNVANVLFCDGSVQTISSSIDREVLHAMTAIDNKPGAAPATSF